MENLQVRPQEGLGRLHATSIGYGDAWLNRGGRFGRHFLNTPHVAKGPFWRHKTTCRSLLLPLRIDSGLLRRVSDVISKILIQVWLFYMGYSWRKCNARERHFYRGKFRGHCGNEELLRLIVAENWDAPAPRCL